MRHSVVCATSAALAQSCVFTSCASNRFRIARNSFRKSAMAGACIADCEDARLELRGCNVMSPSAARKLPESRRRSRVVYRACDASQKTMEASRRSFSSSGSFCVDRYSRCGHCWGMQTSVRFSVSVAVGGQALAVGSVRFAKASESGQFSLSKRAVASGLIPGPLTKTSIVRAAAYLLKERAAVSCVCDGYTVSR